MGVFGKLAFWKKKDNTGDLGKDFGLDKEFGLGDSGMNPDSEFGIETTSPDKYPSFSNTSGMQGNFAQQGLQQQSFQPNYSPPQQFGQPYQSQSYSDQNYVNSKNLEVISSKLDALRASIDSMNQRLANIEAIARGEQEDKKRRYY